MYTTVNITYSLDQTPLSICRHSQIVIAPLEVLKDIANGIAIVTALE